MQCGQEAADCFDAIETFEVEWYDGDGHIVDIGGLVEDLDMLPAPQREPNVTIGAHGRKSGAPACRDKVTLGAERRGRLDQHHDTRIPLR